MRFGVSKQWLPFENKKLPRVTEEQWKKENYKKKKLYIYLKSRIFEHKKRLAK